MSKNFPGPLRPIPATRAEATGIGYRNQPKQPGTAPGLPAQLVGRLENTAVELRGTELPGLVPL